MSTKKKKKKYDSIRLYITNKIAINDMTSDLSVTLGYCGKYSCNNTGIVSPITKRESR